MTLEEAKKEYFALMMKDHWSRKDWKREKELDQFIYTNSNNGK